MIDRLCAESGHSSAAGRASGHGCAPASMCIAARSNIRSCPPSRDDLNSERKATRVAATGDRVRSAEPRQVEPGLNCRRDRATQRARSSSLELGGGAPSGVPKLLRRI